ncbi:hypothetical protein [Streptomyces antimycoticus]|uniref:hypothetical protein n=1 Tax=Streptomyces antimycoticus TaxID=68175 RepID=UPI0038706B3A|nr:hypothetical protein OG751_23030 [Streptomyces antimycoticus]
MATVPRPEREQRDHRNAAYWARVRRIVDQAPPLTDEQRAQILVILHEPRPVPPAQAA